MIAYRIEDLPAELAARIVVNADTGCWEWQHRRGSDPKRYGNLFWGGQLWATHRLVYTLLVGEIAEGLVIDHVYARGCIAKSCCWPAHLEAVTKHEDLQRARRADRVKGFGGLLLKRLADGTTTEQDLAALPTAVRPYITNI